MSAPLRVLLVDDEPLSRRALRQLLREVPDVEIVAECADAIDAAPFVNAVDVLFLDVEMPGPSGVAFARSLDTRTRPAVIFVSAHERYAVPAFDLPALDYLTKPVSPARLGRALERARAAQAARPRLPVRAESEPTRLLTRIGAREILIPLDDVVAIEADGVYVAVHADRRYLVRRPLAELEQALGARFVRVHRSWLVRRDRIREVRATRRGRALVLDTGLIVPVSRRRAGACTARALAESPADAS